MHNQELIPIKFILLKINYTIFKIRNSVIYCVNQLNNAISINTVSILQLSLYNSTCITQIKHYQEKFDKHADFILHCGGQATRVNK